MSDKIIAANTSTLDVKVAASLINQSIDLCNQTFLNVLSTYCSLMKLVWQPSPGLTTQQILTNLHDAGVNVVKLMEFGQIALGMIRQVVALEGLQLADLSAMVGDANLAAINSNAFFDANQNPIPGGQNLTVNQDGTLTVVPPPAA